MSLFVIDSRANSIMPASMQCAMRLATTILRSELHTTRFCTQFKTQDAAKEDHIKEADLKKVLGQDNIFVIDKLRNMKALSARALAMRTFDQHRIFFNPLMLLEMIDREQDEEDFTNEHNEWEDLISVNHPCPLVPQDENTPAASRPPRYNSIAFAVQLHAREAATAAEKAATALLQEEKRIMESTQTALSREQSGRGSRSKYSTASSNPATSLATQFSGAKSTGSAHSPFEPPTKKQRHDQDEEEVTQKSTMTVYQKNVTMLTILLVREAEHLLNYSLSKVVGSAGVTPPAKFTKSDTNKFTDVGHLMERFLYGYCIQHAFDELVSHPFAIDEILGMKEEKKVAKFILQPPQKFFDLIILHNTQMPESLPPLTESDLAFDQTNDVAYVQRVTQPIVLFRPSEDTDSMFPATAPEEIIAPTENPMEWLSQVAFFQGKE